MKLDGEKYIIKQNLFKYGQTQELDQSLKLGLTFL